MALHHMLRAAAQQQAGGASDPYFEYNTLLLTGDGTNGAQNNTFLAANGAAQGPFADPAGYWSNSFDGNGDYLTLAPNTALNQSGNFTQEVWIYLTAYPSATTTIYGFANTNFLRMSIGTTGAVNLDQAYVGIIFTGPSIPLNTWTHVALVRNGSGTNNVTLYVNGISGGQATKTDNVTTSVTGYIAARDDGGANYLSGYLSNLRVTNTAVYTSNFTPSTAPLTAISGTSLLTCQSNVICDTSSNLFAITANGNAAVNNKSPFTISSTYNPYSFSGYFDGAGDYLDLASNAAFAFGTGDFTFETWVYCTQSASAQKAIYDLSSTNTAGSFALFSGGSDWTVRMDGLGNDLSCPVSASDFNNWVHFAVCKSGSTVTFYKNGISVASGSRPSINIIQQTPNIGRLAAFSGYDFGGYISNLRVVKGTAVYTSNFTPSNEPLTAISGTSLLTCQSSTFVDNSPNNFTITVNGNTTVATASNSGLPITRNGNTTQGTFSPYGNLWSNYFDGTGDYLATPSNSAFAYGTGDWTAEAWIYPTSTLASMRIFEYGGDADNLDMNVGATGTISYYNGSTSTTSSTAPINLNAWNHVACVRSSGVVTVYVNGVSALTQSSTPNTTTARVLNIGGVTNNLFTGYISNLRIVKGTALYTSNFTPSTTPLTAVSGTSLLTCQSNRFIDNSSNNFTLTVNGNTSVQRFSPFNPTAAYDAATIGGSGYFDGSGDYLSVPDNVAFEVGSSNFTLEGWFYWTGTGAPFLLAKSATSSYSPYVIGVMGSTGNLGFLASTSGSAWNITITPAGTLEKNTWFHVAAVRNGSTFTLYKNGVSIGTATSTSTLWDNTDSFIIGYANTGTDYFQGYSSTVRLVNGTAVYTSNFTPPTAPLTAITNTSLLCNFTNAGIPDAAMMNDLETVGNAQVSTSVVKYGTGSVYIPANSYLTLVRTPQLNFETGDFTIEMWLYPTQYQGVTVYLYDTRASTTSSGALNIRMSTTGVISAAIGNTTYSTAGTASLNTWSHIAVVRSNSYIVAFVNGVAGTTGSYSGVMNCAANPLIGTDWSKGLFLKSYIDDLRITKGYARYTANFTPPTAALPTY